jgi:hypothetical protein
MAPSDLKTRRVPDSLIISWIDNTQLIKAALSDLNSHSLFDCHSRISDRLSHQKVKTQVQRIKMENHQQRCVMKFLFMQGKRSKAIHGELRRVLEEAAVSLTTIKRWCRRFKDGNFSLDDEFRSGRPGNDIGAAISQFLSKEPFLSASVLAKRLVTSPHTIKKILTRDLGMRKFTRRWVYHDLRAIDKGTGIVDARTLLQALRNDQSRGFIHIMTGHKSWFYYNYESPTMFAGARDEVVPRVSPTIRSKKVMITTFFTANRLVKLVYLPRRQKYNKEYVINKMLKGVNQECNHGTRYMVTMRTKSHMDNCRVHNERKHCRRLTERRPRDWIIHLIRLS